MPTGRGLKGVDGIEAFVHTKRRWRFEATREVSAKHKAVQMAFHEWLKERTDRDLKRITRQPPNSTCTPKAQVPPRAKAMREQWEGSIARYD